jgi:hypothetical protein
LTDFHTPARLTIDRDDVGALLREPHRVAAALTARGSGDERNLARYPTSHP